MPKLKWISDNDLSSAVMNLLDTAKRAKDDAAGNFNKNVIDPFSAVFEMAGFNMTFEDWVKNEEARQAQKTLQNFIGEFHQIILGACEGWMDMSKGNIIDLLNKKKKVVAEVKNKYNTISGGNLADLYWSLESAVMNKTSVYKGYTAYYVSIIPKKPQRFNIEFTPSDKQKGTKCPGNKLIRQIDGASFYDLVTGHENSLENLFDALPAVISEVTGNNLLNKSKLKILFKMAYE